MMSSAILFGIVCVGLAMLLNVYRLVVGPDAIDRVVALDTLYINAIVMLRRDRRCGQVPPAREHHRMIETVIAVFVVIGAVFTLIGSIGLARFPDFFTRLHGPTKATTLGAGAVIIASVLNFSVPGGSLNLDELLIILFLFMTAPVSAHLVARAALVREVHSVTHGSSTGHGHRRPEDEPGADEPARVEVPQAPEEEDEEE